MNDSVNVIVKGADGRTLLQMREGKPDICSPLAWGLWGGAIEPEDADYLAAAAREFEEELGIVCAPVDFELLAQRTRNAGGEGYLVRYKTPVAWGDFRVFEGAGAAFFTLAEIQQLGKISSNIAWYLEHKPEVFA